MDYSEWIGKKIKKVSGKPFKSTLKIGTPMSICFNKYSRKQAFRMDDGSVVDCHVCELGDATSEYMYSLDKLMRDNPDVVANALLEACEACPPPVETKINGRMRVPGYYPIESVHAFVTQHIDVDNHMMIGKKDRNVRHFFDQYFMKPWSLRYFVFIKKGTKCSCCGMEGQYYCIERNPNDNGYHFNLYGIKNGEEVLMTKDHHIPRAGGGEDILANLVPMCSECNTAKGSKVPNE